jgi:uncharacterized iron-regulated membrane protein
MKTLFLRRLHKWVAIIVGAQIVLWCVSGAMFAWLDHHDVSGKRLVREPAALSLPPSHRMSAPRQWWRGGALYEVRLLALHDRWVFRLDGDHGVSLHDVTDGRRVQIDEATVRVLAATRYAGDGSVISTTHEPEGSYETRKHGAAWAVRYDDEAATTLWFSSDDGRLLEARSTAWRVFDFFWMLHTMDYRGRDNFNNPLVILFATASLWVGLTGLLLVLRVYVPRRKANPLP